MTVADVQYTVRHVTRFAYQTPISESILEARMRPRTNGGQHCLRFELTTTPRARVFAYRDWLGNEVHHFDVPGKHARLSIVAESLVEVQGQPELPASRDAGAWG